MHIWLKRTKPRFQYVRQKRQNRTIIHVFCHWALFTIGRNRSPNWHITNRKSAANLSISKPFCITLASYKTSVLENTGKSKLSWVQVMTEILLVLPLTPFSLYYHSRRPVKFKRLSNTDLKTNLSFCILTYHTKICVQINEWHWIKHKQTFDFTTAQ